MASEYNPDFSWFKKEFISNGNNVPIPFLRKDLMDDQIIGYTDGQENHKVLYPISVLENLTRSQFNNILDECGTKIDPNLIQKVLSVSQTELATIAQSSPNSEPVILIGSAVRYLYIRYCQQLNEFLPSKAEEYFRARFNKSSDLDFRTSNEHLLSLQKIYGQVIVPSRTTPGAKKLTINFPSKHTLEFLAFPVENQIISHLAEAMDYPEGVFAIINPDGSLLLQDPFGSRIMQPFYHSPPYPDQFTHPQARLRSTRNAIRSAAATEIATPELKNGLLNMGTSLNYAESTNASQLDIPAAESLIESFLCITAKNSHRAAEIAKVLGETQLLHVLINCGLKTENIQALTEIYWLVSELFAHLPIHDPALYYLIKFYQGHVSQLTPEEIIESNYCLLEFHSFFFTNLNPEKQSHRDNLESFDLAAKKRRQKTMITQ